MRALRSFVRDAWRLARPYYRSDEKWSAWGLLTSILALRLLLVGMTVVLSFWNREFFNSLQDKFDYRKVASPESFALYGSRGAVPDRILTDLWEGLDV